MKVIIRSVRQDQVFLLYLILYTAFSLTTLVVFPFVHSDEAWLSGLTRAMMSSSNLSVTEPFFDLYPREPHAIKIFYHLMQMPIFLTIGYSVFSARLLSLICSVLAVFLFYYVLRVYTNSTGGGQWLALIMTVIFSLDVQVLYAAHFARQEIVLLLLQLILFGIHARIPEDREPGLFHCVASAVIIGVAIGIHPNSFLIAMPILTYYFVLWFQKRVPIFQVILLVGLIAAFATFFVLASIWMNPGFIKDYLTYGSNLGVTASLADKIQGVVPYIQKLFYQISGTYYTPDIRFQLILFPISAILVGLLIVLGKGRRLAVLSLVTLLMTLASIMVIGRYSQPSVLFFFPAGYFLVFFLLQAIQLPGPVIWTRIAVYFMVISLGTGIFTVTGKELTNQASAGSDYAAYLSEIRSVVPADATTLANLNAEYCFETGFLLDYRNLGNLESQNLTFDQYIETRNIEYILYPDELDYIYEQRPLWNDMYGNLYPYYDEMQAFLENRCILLHRFQTPYAIRIARFFPDSQRTLSIYLVIAKP